MNFRIFLQRYNTETPNRDRTGSKIFWREIAIRNDDKISIIKAIIYIG
jgi:hypothetical protein